MTNASTAWSQTVGMVLSYPMMFICGATIPLELLPSSVRQIADFLPLTCVVKLMRGLGAGEAWSSHWLEVVVLSGSLVACGVVSARFFRWE
jgi:ABC-2 type transport system permease protein